MFKPLSLRWPGYLEVVLIRCPGYLEVVLIIRREEREKAQGHIFPRSLALFNNKNVRSLKQYRQS